MKTKHITTKKKVTGAIATICMVLAFVFTSQTAQAQAVERTVSGVVKTHNSVVPGAAIVLKGTNIGVMADDDGAFTFPQPLKDNDVLIVSSMAFEDIEVKIERGTTYIEPFLEGTAIVIVGALRTAPAQKKAIPKSM